MADLPEAWLRGYYRNFYPVEIALKWLSYGKHPSEYLQQREIAFILESGAHIRYLTFTDAGKFHSKLDAVLPHKIDFGAVYNHPCEQRLSFNDFTAEERELVFDIDLDEYNDIRKCCTDQAICQKCFRWIVIAAKVLSTILKDHFGFHHMLWLFSGRRGIHCWVADKEARKLNNNGRAAITTYLSLISNTPLVMDTEYNHPLFDDAYKAIMNTGEMEHLVVEQGWLDSEDSWKPILQHCTDVDMRNRLLDQFNDKSCKTSTLRWRLMERQLNQNSHASNAAKVFFKSFVLQYAYPRLDVNVSVGTNHLLKSPFCIHPKTGIIAVPLDVNKIDQVKIEEFPTLKQLMTEYHKHSSDSKENNIKFYGCLAPYIENFEKFVNGAISC